MQWVLWMMNSRTIFSIFFIIVLIVSGFTQIYSPANIRNEKARGKRTKNVSKRTKTINSRYSGKNTWREEYGIFRKDGNLESLVLPKTMDTNTRQLKKWTFMVYLDADNDLEEAGIDDFLEMSSVGSTSNVSIVVLFDRTSGYSSSYDDWSDTKYFYITHGLEPYSDNAVNQTWGERNMGDPQTIVDFVSYSMQNYPSEHYALILWDHGGGLSGVCWDKDNGYDNINLHELRNALETIYNELGVKIDILGFDACLVGMMEVAYQVRDYVDYIVFSQEYEPGDGWPYDDILDLLTSNPDMRPEELAEVIVEKYVDSYRHGSQGYDPYATQSAINLSALMMIAFRKMDRLVGEILRNYDKYVDAINYASNNAERFYYSNEKDIIHFLQLLETNISDEYMVSLIEETIEAINLSIISAGHLNGHPYAHGLSVNIPSSYSSSYDTILMSIDHQWDEFIRKKTGNNVDLWFYDIVCLCSDGDNNGYYENGFIYVDLDSDSSQNVYVEVYGYNGTSEVLIGNSTIETISGASSKDIIVIPMQMPRYRDIYFLRFDVYNTSGLLIKKLYYYSDDDVCGLPLEYKSGYPEIIVVSPIPSSKVSEIVLLSVGAQDSDGVAWVKVKVGDAWYDMTYNVTSGLWEYVWDTRNSSEDWYTIIINASDGTNVSSVSPKYFIDNLNITIISPDKGAILRGIITIKAEFESVEEINATNAYAIFENSTYQTPPIPLAFNLSSGYFEGTYNTSKLSDGTYSILVNISTNRSTFETKTIDKVFVDNYIEPILIVDDDVGAPYEQYYIGSLEAIGYTMGRDFEVWSVIDKGDATYELLCNRSAVIWFTGDDYKTTLTDSEINAIKQYLDNNGSLFISGQDIGYDINNTNYDFYTQYLKAVYIGDDADVDSVFGTGSPFRNIIYNLSDGDGANDNEYPDIIKPRDDLGAWAILNYSYYSSAAIAYNGSYRLVYFAFPFEAINSEDDREVCMIKILDFLLRGPRKVNVEIVYPEPESNISGYVTIKVNASSLDGYIVGVMIKIAGLIDWTPMVYDPFEGLWKYYWDTSNLPDQTYAIAVRAIDNNSQVGYDSITVKTDNFDEWILVVDDDVGQTYEQFYITSLQDIGLEKGKDFALWNTYWYASPTYSILSDYHIIIWFTGDDSETTLTAEDINALEQYLDNGGGLFISGQDIGYDINDTYHDFYTQYLRAEYVQDSSNIDNVFGVGDPFIGTTYGLSSGDGADNNEYPDVIKPRDDLGAWSILNYSSDMTAAIAYNDSYRLVYFAFPFEAINSSSDRANCMQTIISWLSPKENVVINILEPANGSILNTSMVYVEWEASPTDLIDHFEIYLDGNLVNDSIPKNQMNYTLDIMTDGSHQIVVVAVDVVGNETQDSVDILVDTTAPYLVIISPIDNYNTSKNYVVVRWWGYDSNGIDHYEVNLNGSGWINVGLNTSYNFTGLPEGHYTVYVKAVDIANNSVVQSREFTVDQTPPRVLITSPANNSNVNSTFTVFWIAYDNETGIFLLELRLDGSVVARFYYWNMSNNYTFHNVSNGEHCIDLIGYDFAGNTNESFIYVTVVSSVIVVIIQPADKSYLNYTDIEVKWVIIYHENPLDHTEIYLDGNLVDTLPPTQTSYILENVSEGSHRIEVIVVDIYGKYGIDYVDIIVDITSPSLMFVSPPYDGYIYNTSDVTITWLAYDSGGIYYFEVKLDNGNWINVGLNTSYTFTGVEEGNHTVFIRAVDLAGNIEVISRWFYVDLYPPVIKITSPSNGSSVYVNFTVWWDAWDDGTYVERIELYVNDTLWVVLIYGVNMSDHYDFVNMDLGICNITIIAYDAKGDSSFDSIIVYVVSINVIIENPNDGEWINTSWIILEWRFVGSPDGFRIYVNGTEVASLPSYVTSYNLTGLEEGYIIITVSALVGDSEVGDAIHIIVDLTPPKFTYISISNITYINITNISISWEAEDNMGDIVLYYIYFDGEIIGATAETNYMLTDLSEGRHIVKIVAEDEAGNRGTVAIIVVVDLSPPTVEFSVLNATYHNESWYINNTNITLCLNIDDLSYDHAVLIIYNDTWRHEYQTDKRNISIELVAGEYRINITVYDKFGNSGETHGKIIIDTVPPSLIITSPENNTVIFETSITINWEVEDNYGILHCYIRLDDGEWIEVTNQSSYTFSSLSLGDHVVYILVIDLAGNSVAKSIVFSVKTRISHVAPYLLLSLLVIAAIIIVAVLLRRRKQKEAYGGEIEMEITEEL